MSNTGPNLNYTAADQINPAVFVKNTGNFTCSQCGSGDRPIGVSTIGVALYDETFAAATGDQIAVWGDGQETWLTLGGTVNAPSTTDLLKPDSNGNGVVATSGAYFGAIALQNGVAGDIVRVKVVGAGVKD